MTERIREFLRKRNDEGPCLVVDLDVVRDNYNAFARAMPDTRVFYAVKANPAPEVLTLLAKLGSCFDTASLPKSRWCWQPAPRRIASALATPSRRSATLRAPTRSAFPCMRWIARKKSRRSPGRHRQPACSAASSPIASGPIGRCHASSAANLKWRQTCCCTPSSAGLEPMAFRSMWVPSSATSTPGIGACFGKGHLQGLGRARHYAVHGQSGRRLPDQVPEDTFQSGNLCQCHLQGACASIFGNAIPETIIEPGRGMVGNAGMIEAEVVLISKKSQRRPVRWVYLDIGKFGGLAETMDESIRYPITHPARWRRHGTVRAGRADLRFRRRAVREGALHAPGQPGDR